MPSLRFKTQLRPRKTKNYLNDLGLRKMALTSSNKTNSIVNKKTSYNVVGIFIV